MRSMMISDMDHGRIMGLVDAARQHQLAQARTAPKQPDRAVAADRAMQLNALQVQLRSQPDLGELVVAFLDAQSAYRKRDSSNRLFDEMCFRETELRKALAAAGYELKEAE